MGIAYCNISCIMLFPFFYYINKEMCIISRLKLKTLQDAYDCYGKENLIPIGKLKQAMFYITKGVQPVFTYPSEMEGKEDRATFWFLKSETQWVFKKWQENRPIKE